MDLWILQNFLLTNLHTSVLQLIKSPASTWVTNKHMVHLLTKEHHVFFVTKHNVFDEQESIKARPLVWLSDRDS